MPKLFPDPVCKLPGEYGFVAAVMAAPLDDLPKLVYADWLDEHNDPRGQFLRVWLAARTAGKKLPKPDKTLSNCWLSVVGFTLDEWLKRQGEPAWGEAIRMTAEPGLVVRTVRLEDGETVPTGSSKMGGLPDLDPDVEWPEGQDGEMAFLAQWNLAELGVSPCAAKLPKKGLLSFFVDLAPFVEDSGYGESKVLFNPNPVELDEREPEVIREANELPACRVEFREWLSPPDHRSPVLEVVIPSHLWGKYHEPDFYDLQPKGSHLVLGYPTGMALFDPMPTGGDAWSFLTQFGPDNDLRLDAYDSGTWHFMIPDADLKKGRFDDVTMNVQPG